MSIDTPTAPETEEDVIDMDAESKSDEVLDEVELEEETDPEPEDISS